MSRHDMQFPVIVDSGANYHMFRAKEFFVNILPANGTVILGDGKTTWDIQGVGTVRCKLGDHIVTIPDVRCIPGLSESVYSLFLHIKSPYHGVESSFADGLFLKFPKFKSQAIIGSHDIYLDMKPLHQSNLHPSNESVSTIENTMLCRPITETNQLNEENGQLNNMIKALHRYYGEVKTQRQLGLPVPNGFRPQSSIQQQFTLHMPPQKSVVPLESSLSSSDIETLTLDESHTTPIHSNRMTSFHEPPTVLENPVGEPKSFIPIIRSVDKPSSSYPWN
jgi:hypothetical protein